MAHKQRESPSHHAAQKGFLAVSTIEMYSGPSTVQADGSGDPVVGWDPFDNRIDFGTFAAVVEDRPGGEAFGLAVVAEGVAVSPLYCVLQLLR